MKSTRRHWVIISSRAAFTLIEIIMVLFLIGIIALPFTQMFSFGAHGTAESFEHVFAFNLAREKMEEVRSLPFEMVKSDFETYRDIYSDRPEMDQMYTTTEFFEKNFTDIVTESRLKDDKEKEMAERVIKKYEAAFRRPYEVYPDEAGQFKRCLMVDDKYDRKNPPRLKKVTIRVLDKQGHRMAEVVTLVGKHE